MEIAGFAAVRRRELEPNICVGYGDTLEACRSSARTFLNVESDAVWARILYSLAFVSLDADAASEVAEMLAAAWIV